LIQVDGTVVIFDIETNGVARKLQGHTRQIQSLRQVQTRL
jgi:COMPASS component SWD1